MMGALNREGALWATVAGVGLTAVLVYGIERPEHFSAFGVLQFADTVVAIDAVALAIFVRWAWRWPGFARWLVCVPVLHKRWQGTVTPIFVDENAPQVPIAATLEIRQSLFELSCLMRTAETTSHSFAAGIFRDPVSQEQRLTYSYAADPALRGRDRNARHDGTAVMTMTAKPALTGTYWTDRLTRGELHFERNFDDEDWYAISRPATIANVPEEL